MKTWNAIALAAIGAATVALMACGKTNNSSDPAPAVASACTTSWDGTMHDQYGRNCSAYGNGVNTCTNAALNYSTGQYVDRYTGMPVNCNSTGFDNYNTFPYYGYNQGTTQQGCTAWTQYIQMYYGVTAYYIPVDFGNGQIMCMNTAYLQQNNPSYGVNWNQYYYSQQPIYYCQSYECGGYSGGGGNYYGGYYNGYQYSNCNNLNFGIATGGFEMGINVGGQGCY